jgi:CMP-N-acetylneuraminic acid synthetase
MNKLGITLARGGSKGVPKKNIRMIAGKPLLAWTIEEVKKCTLLDRYIVSSDCDEVLSVAQRYGADVLKRPEYLARDNTPHIPALIHALEWAEDRDDVLYDVVVDLRCTNPLKLAFDIDSAIWKMEETLADVVVGVSKLEDHHPSRIKTIVADTLADVWPEPLSGQRQDLRPDVYIRNGSIYVVMADALRNGILNTGSPNIRPYIMPPERGVNIDTEIDFYTVEGILNDRQRNNPDV